MKSTHKITIGLLLMLVVAASIGLYLTGRPAAPIRSTSKTVSEDEGQDIKLQYLDEALRLAAQAATPEERDAAEKVLGVADREMDLEYTEALQYYSGQAPKATPEIVRIQDRIAKLRTQIEARQAEADQLGAAEKKARGTLADGIQQRLSVSQAELNLFKEMLDDAKDELARAGGDPQSRIQQLEDQHKAASNAADTFRFPSLPPPPNSSSIIAKWSEWKAGQQKRSQILDEQKEAYTAAAALAGQHDALEKRIGAEQVQRKALTGHMLTAEEITNMISGHANSATPSNGENPPSTEAGGNRHAAAESALSLIHRISND